MLEAMTIVGTRPELFKTPAHKDEVQRHYTPQIENSDVLARWKRSMPWRRLTARPVIVSFRPRTRKRLDAWGLTGVNPWVTSPSPLAFLILSDCRFVRLVLSYTGYGSRTVWRQQFAWI
ncbi:hypothetical protein LP417_09755 [Polaromonas sp. P1-6]|nr:hypothetical protein LP417_09755 [Polaromonas sp. P1-6]